MAKPALHTFKSIADLMRYLGQPGPVHPLITIMQYDRQNVQIGHPGDRIVMDFYKISFKTSFSGKVTYGQHHYDFQDGGLAFIGPRQIVAVPPAGDKSHEGLVLFFHPDVLRKHALANTIHTYSFFNYSTSEALFLSEKEKKVIASLFASISDELSNNIDAFTQDILVSQIEQLLNQSNRCYHRQFITREVAHNELLVQMEQLLSTLFEEKALQHGLPTVQSIAGQLNVSPHYLSDMLRSLTGQNTQQHIHNKLIEKAKEMLSSSRLSVAEIAYQLGFGYPQSFSKLFKRKMNVTPLEYRQSFN